jgi:ABC-type transport system involved in multi-copper enzyme maturation permease subunit
VWLLAALIITVKGSTAISGERAHETMEALLSTPMTSREILTEKVAGMSRLMMVLAIPILTIHATLFTMSIGGSSLFLEIVRHAGAAVVYGLLTLTATWLAMQFLAWFSTGIGMRFHSQSRSILISVCAVTGCVAICFLAAETFFSFLLSTFSESYTQAYNDPSGRAGIREEITIVLVLDQLLKYVFTPGGSMVLNEAYLGAAGSSGLFWRDRSSGNLFQNAAPQLLQNWSLGIACCGILVQAGITYAVRYLVLRWAPPLLNRRDQQSDSASRSLPRDLPEDSFETAVPDQSSGLPQAV